LADPVADAVCILGPDPINQGLVALEEMDMSPGHEHNGRLERLSCGPVPAVKAEDISQQAGVDAKKDG
jgi:hypothetical protein